MDQTKTANQLYKESGSSLPFSMWLEKEKEKASLFIKNAKLNEIITKEKEKLGLSTPNKKSNDTIFGLSKNVIIISSVLLISAIGFKIYQNFKK